MWSVAPYKFKLLLLLLLLLLFIKKRQTAFIRDRRDSVSYRLLRNKAQWEIRSAKYDYYHRKVDDLEHKDSKKWWKQIKLLTGQDIKQEWYHQFLGENCPDIKSLANMVNDHFIILKDFAPELVPLIMDIYNCSLREGYVPDLLKWSIINPLSLFSASRNSIWLETYLSDMHTCQSHRRVCAQQARCENCGKTWSTPVRKGEALHHAALIYILQAIHEATELWELWG